MAFVHLHQHTEHSAFDGLSRIGDVPRRAAELGMNAVALTDHGSLTGALKFTNACKDAGVKPIIGMEAYIAIGSRFGRDSRTILNDEHAGMDGDEDSEDGDSDGSTKSKVYEHLTILARNQQGWKNLLALHNASTHPDAYWYKPRIDYDLIAEKGDGLIILTGCLAGPIAGPLSQSALWLKRVPTADEAAQLTTSLAENHALLQAAVDAGVRFRSVAARYQDEDKKKAEESKSEASAADKQAEGIRRVIASITDRLNAETHAAALKAEADSNLQMLIAAVGHENVYLEIMFHGIEAEQAVLSGISDLSVKYNVPMVVTNDSHYLNHDHADSHDAFLTAGKKDVRLDTPGRFAFNGEGYWLKSEAEMRAIKNGPKWAAACDMTQVIADRIEDNVIPDYGMMLPKYPIPAGFSSEVEFLRHLIVEGGNKILGTSEWPQVYLDRIETELEVIEFKDVVSYFLIVWDFINWCRSDAPVKYDDPTATRKKPITMGLGRGSAAGALVSYMIGIVGVDPIENNLLFERFLERGRTGMPDIDIDTEDVRRPEALEYLQYRWGAENVAQIGGWGMARSKSAIKDAARVLQPSGARPENWEQMSQQERSDHLKAESELRTRVLKVSAILTAAVPMKGVSPMPFKVILDRTNPVNSKFWAAMEECGELADKILALAVNMESVAKSPSIHPCGVVVSPVPLAEIVPLRRPSYKATEANNLDSLWVICWDGEDVDAYGLLKMDVLGLLNLGLAARALDYIFETTGKRMEFDHLPHPDTKGDPQVDAAWALMASGNTSGVFQLASAGMKKVAQDVASTRLTDISAVVALFRPGPLAAGVPDQYAARKHGREPVSYDQFSTDPVEQEWIAKILGDTYGVFVFQEQLMQLGTVIAGFDAAQRSTLRKAVGKKKPEEMAKVGKMLMEGAEKEFWDDNGVLISPVFSAETAARTFELMKGSAEYLFNAAHSAAYGYLAYITAYLKASWPVEYGAAVLAVSKSEVRLAALNSLAEEGITVLAPDVNKSRGDTAPFGDLVALGLKEIRDVGEMGFHIATERRYGPYDTMGNLVSRVKAPQKGADESARKINSAALVGLIEAGALDNIPGTRLSNLLAARAAESDPVLPAYDWTALEQGRRQRQRIGTIIGEHPLRQLKNEILAWSVPMGGGRFGPAQGQKATPLQRITDENGGSFVTTGIISRWEEGTYSGGTKRRVNFTLEGSVISYDGVIWERDLEKLSRAGSIPEEGDLVAMAGEVQVRTIVLGGGNSEETGDDSDDEDTVLETTTVKELKATNLWPINIGSRVKKLDTPIPSFSFRERWESSRPDPNAPAPARRARAKKVAAIEADDSITASAPVAAPVEPALTAVAATPEAPLEARPAPKKTSTRALREEDIPMWMITDPEPEGAAAVTVEAVLAGPPIEASPAAAPVYPEPVVVEPIVVESAPAEAIAAEPHSVEPARIAPVPYEPVYEEPGYDESRFPDPWPAEDTYPVYAEADAAPAPVVAAQTPTAVVKHAEPPVPASVMAPPVDLDEYRERKAMPITVWLEDSYPDEVFGEIITGDPDVLVLAGTPTVPKDKANEIGPGSIVRFKAERWDAVIGITEATFEEAQAVAAKICTIPVDDPGWVQMNVKQTGLSWHVFDWKRHALGVAPGDYAGNSQTA